MNKSIIRVELSTGVVLNVTPVSNTMVAMLREQAKEVHPDPDGRPFLKEIPKAFGGETWIVDTSDRVYIAYKNIALQKQVDWAEQKLLTVACDCEAKSSVIAMYWREIKAIYALRGADVPQDKDELWNVALTHFVVANPDDREVVSKAIRWRLPVTEEEITEQVKYFRLEV